MARYCRLMSACPSLLFKNLSKCEIYCLIIYPRNGTVTISMAHKGWIKEFNDPPDFYYNISRSLFAYPMKYRYHHLLDGLSQNFVQTVVVPKRSPLMTLANNWLTFVVLCQCGKDTDVSCWMNVKTFLIPLTFYLGPLTHLYINLSNTPTKYIQNKWRLNQPKLTILQYHFWT